MNTVITAAHCIQSDGFHTTIMAGHVNREKPRQIRNMKSFIIHKDYEYTDIPRNDIALIFPDSPFKYSDYVKPICLLGTARNDLDIDDAKCIITGYGVGLINVQNNIVQFALEVLTD